MSREHRRTRHWDTGLDPSRRVPLRFTGPDALSMTQQHFRDECDINVLMARYLSGGTLMQRDPSGALYGDFSSVPEYQEAQNILLRANEQFANLPSKIRDRFRNSPAELLAFVQDPANKPEAIELGLMPKPATTASPVDTPSPAPPGGQGAPPGPPPAPPPKP